MGINIAKTDSRNEYSFVAASALRMTHQIITLPPGVAASNAIAQNQTITSLASNALATSTRGLINPVLLNGAGNPTPQVIDPSNTDSGVYLPYPFCPVIKSNAYADAIFRWRGINHLGRPVYFTEKKSNATGAGNTYFQSQCAFSFIETLEILSWSGPGTDNLVVGYDYDFVQTGSAGPVKRVPVPFEFSQPSDIAGLTFLEVGGATWASTAWAAGDSVLLWTTGSGSDLSGYPTSPTFATALFALGRASTQPTAPFRVAIMQKPTALLSRMRENPNPIVL